MRSFAMVLASISALMNLGACRPKLAAPPQATPSPAFSSEPSHGVLDVDEDPELSAALAEAEQSIENPELRTLLRRHWAWKLEQQPEMASRLGVHRYDDKISTRGPESEALSRAARAFFLGWARTIPETGLSENDATSLDIFASKLDAAQRSEVCEFETWTVSARNNPVTEWNQIDQLHRLETAADGEAFLSRLRTAPTAIDGQIQSLASGVAAGRFANAESTRRVITMVESQLDTPIEQWPSVLAGKKSGVDRWSEKNARQFRSQLLEVVRLELSPAIRRYGDFLKSQVFPHARGDESPGLTRLPAAKRCYAARIRAHTGLDLSAEKIHAIGLAEIDRLDGEFRSLGKKLFGTDTLEEILNRLRTDPALYFNDGDEVEAAAQSALNDAREAMPRYFERLPRATCIVSPMPDYEAPFSTIAYYRPAHADGSKPGEYVINRYAPTTRPRYEARVLALHEAIPGHHLQISIAQELPALPAFRKHGGLNFFVEGWALYSERLGDEMGLYDDDLDRMGVISFDAWRASRLVVDTGLHAKGWSRGRAVQFMLDHTALAANNIDNEVDRYIVWPAQALSYKLGQLEIFRLRKEAKTRLGERFSIKKFHDAVLGAGAVPPNVLRTRIERYIESTNSDSGESRPPHTSVLMAP